MNLVGLLSRQAYRSIHPAKQPSADNAFSVSRTFRVLFILCQSHEVSVLELNGVARVNVGTIHCLEAFGDVDFYKRLFLMENPWSPDSDLLKQ